MKNNSMHSNHFIKPLTNYRLYAEKWKLHTTPLLIIIHDK